MKVIRPKSDSIPKLTKKAQGISANALTQHTLRVLAMKGYFAWRNNNGAVYDPTKKVFRANNALKGVPDILGYRKTDARFLSIEIKAGKDKLSKEQADFLMGVTDAGGIAYIVRSIEDIEKLIKEVL